MASQHTHDGKESKSTQKSLFIHLLSQKEALQPIYREKLNPKTHQTIETNQRSRLKHDLLKYPKYNKKPNFIKSPNIK